MLCRRREISATPIQLHMKEVCGECYPLNLAPNPEMKAAGYAGKEKEKTNSGYKHDNKVSNGIFNLTFRMLQHTS